MSADALSLTASEGCLVECHGTHLKENLTSKKVSVAEPTTKHVPLVRSTSSSSLSPHANPNFPHARSDERDENAGSKMWNVMDTAALRSDAPMSANVNLSRGASGAPETPD